jgi:hypothetical protein
MPARSLRSLVRRSPAKLGCCPACGHVVKADASALRYRGGFYHLVCALWHRESRGQALAAAR